jgi:hypothetical protein
MHKDVTIQAIDESDDNDHDTQNLKLNRTRPTADIEQFFRRAPKVPGDKKGRVTCLSCK